MQSMFSTASNYEIYTKCKPQPRGCCSAANDQSRRHRRCCVCCRGRKARPHRAGSCAPLPRSPGPIARESASRHLVAAHALQPRRGAQSAAGGGRSGSVSDPLRTASASTPTTQIAQSLARSRRGKNRGWPVRSDGPSGCLRRTRVAWHRRSLACCPGRPSRAAPRRAPPGAMPTGIRAVPKGGCRRVEAKLCPSVQHQ